MAPQTAEARRLRNRTEMRRAILDAAEGLLVERGIEAFSMRKLAERSGCRPPTLYHYFRDKEQLVDDLLEERLSRLVSELRAVERSGDAVADMQALFGAFARFGVRNPDHYQLLVAPRSRPTEELPSGAESRRLLQSPLDAFVRQGRVDAQRRELLEQALWSFLHGWILLQTSRPEADWQPDLLRRGIEAIVQGLVEPGSGERSR